MLKTVFYMENLIYTHTPYETSTVYAPHHCGESGGLESYNDSHLRSGTAGGAETGCPCPNPSALQLPALLS